MPVFDSSAPQSSPHQVRDTIAAIATPPGRGGIGIIRISGPEAVRYAHFLLADAAADLAPGRARLCSLIDPQTRALLDEAVVTFFRAPRSYTGEDVIEIAAHGSPVLLHHLLRLLLQYGARMARAGEFTERAFLAGRLDLTQAEAVRDLIEAQTIEQAQMAAGQLGGALSRSVAPHKAALIALIAQLEAGIDFAEDDTPVLDSEALAASICAVEESLRLLESSFARGRLLREGVRLAIVGRPNVGKSSLFNRLLGRSRAIVTDEPGTTRDTIEERLSLDGIPVELVDTAGLREATGEAERMGIEKSREAFADAGLVLVVLDSTEPFHAEERRMLHDAAGRLHLVALNKSDCAEQTADAAHRASALRMHVRELTDAPVLPTSALTGDGISALRAAMHSVLAGEGGVAPEAATLSNLRQHTAVVHALHALQTARTAADAGVPHEMLLLDLYAALSELDSLTGTTTPDDILNLIFSTFCIGK